MLIKIDEDTFLIGISFSLNTILKFHTLPKGTQNIG